MVKIALLTLVSLSILTLALINAFIKPSYKEIEIRRECDGILEMLNESSFLDLHLIYTRIHRLRDKYRGKVDDYYLDKNIKRLLKHYHRRRGITMPSVK